MSQVMRIPKYLVALPLYQQATEAEKLKVKRISLEQYAREATRTRATPTAQVFYRNKRIELVGAQAFDTYCRQYVENQAARRSRSLSTPNDTIVAHNLVRPRADDDGFATPIRRKRTMSAEPKSDRQEKEVDMDTQLEESIIKFVDSIKQFIITITILLTTIKRI